MVYIYAVVKKNSGKDGDREGSRPEERKQLKAFRKLLKKEHIPSYLEDVKQKDGNGKKQRRLALIVMDEDFLPCIERTQARCGMDFEIQKKKKSISLIQTGGDCSLDVIDDDLLQGYWKTDTDSGDEPELFG
jgi:hypothetical protein